LHFDLLNLLDEVSFELMVDDDAAHPAKGAAQPGFRPPQGFFERRHLHVHFRHIIIP
jgi:hypothetical protein